VGWECGVEPVTKAKQVKKNAVVSWCDWTYEGGKGGGKGGGGGGGGCTTLLVPSLCGISWGTAYAVVSNGVPASPPFPVLPAGPPTGGA